MKALVLSLYGLYALGWILFFWLWITTGGTIPSILAFGERLGLLEHLSEYQYVSLYTFILVAYVFVPPFLFQFLIRRIHNRQTKMSARQV